MQIYSALNSVTQGFLVFLFIFSNSSTSQMAFDR